MAIAGDLDHAAALDLVAPTFGTGNGIAPDVRARAARCRPARPTCAATATPPRPTSASAVPAYRRDHPDSWTVGVLNGVLGEGMSSRLFLAVREELGLAYDVGSGITEYADSGALGVYAGVDPDQLEPALEAILAELARLRDEPVPPDELAKAKAYLSGGLELRMDDTRHLASWIGGQEALHDRVLTLDEALEAIAAVTADDIRRVAGELFRDDVLRMAVVAPRGPRARSRPGPPAAGLTGPDR